MMFNIKGTLIAFLTTCLMLLTVQSCGVKYSLGGSKIPDNVKTYTVTFFENISPMVSATLSQSFTEGLKERIRTQSRLSQVNQDGDVEFGGLITNYSIAPAAVEAGSDRAALNRLTITVKVKFTNRKDETGKSDFEESFTQFKEIRGETNSSQEQITNAEIVKMLTEDIFNKAFNNW